MALQLYALAILVKTLPELWMTENFIGDLQTVDRITILNNYITNTNFIFDFNKGIVN